jgi:hypothetical protein
MEPVRPFSIDAIRAVFGVFRAGFLESTGSPGKAA